MKARKSHVFGLITATVLGMSLVLPATAQQSDTATVSGETVSTATITLATDSVSFGQITSTGLKAATSAVTGSASATFAGASVQVTRNVTNTPTGFNALQVLETGGVPLGSAENTVVVNPGSFSDTYYVNIDGDEPRGTFSYTVTYSVSTVS